MDFLHLFSRDHLLQCLKLREDETKLGEQFQLLTQFNAAHLQQAKAQGCRFALVGICEDIGPRANQGQGGAEDGFSAAISVFANLQANRFLTGHSCLLVGSIRPTAITPHHPSPQQLRQAVAELDQQVITVCQALFAAGLEPIVIGGGHNNAFGLITALHQAKHRPAAVVNLDPHCDFRPLEGRHSGNGFSYCAQNGSLAYYHVLGLHEQKNSETSLAQLSQFGGRWHSFQDIWTRRCQSLDSALEEISTALNATQAPVGLELDMDAIAEMPASAMTFAGVPLLDACRYVDYLSRHSDCAYLHLAEAAPARHANLQSGRRITGQALAELMLAYLQGRLASQTK
ncbi:formimidoylglutamase HutG [Shewanella sp. NFH-SH190041]|uniref:formimidoylglutamase n=1 Tax=Shewanella sp. NFH-SH190041 TaxID=2950245 RepID=UPI0021C4C1DD|nr:formimidoylglutamase [Shewanella sp. NFH-SH190041]BDM63049.1 formimidoylglutamase HutG [Shewanella sp. NFH-SH190041]